jgi:hypothetical protein
MVEADLAAGRLVRLALRSWDGAAEPPRLGLVLAHRRDRAFGPAARWLVERLAPDLPGDGGA